MTHYLTPSLSLTPSTAAALLSAQTFVTSAWLAEIVRLGDLPAGHLASAGTSLEDAFALPPEAPFRPPFAPALPPALKSMKVWDANEARMGMLLGRRFVCVNARGGEVDAELRAAFAAGGAAYESFAADAGAARWRRVLIKSKSNTASGSNEEDSGLILVAEEDAVKLAVGQEAWDELVKEARGYARPLTELFTYVLKFPALQSRPSFYLGQHHLESCRNCGHDPPGLCR